MKHQFKTNINCGGCVAAVTPHLNGEKAISTWKVDTQNPEKVLTVETEDLDANQVCALVHKAGFTAEPLQ
ncbi:MAG: copper chaperone [Chitinophagaceae bacterium]|nr:MAG: copper chaperone [Chitinophagaceae bacterium]